MKAVGFDNERYVKLQSQHIRERIGKFGGKLYLEFGGKLFDDFHASRVLPGFAPDSKLKMLLELKDAAEIIITISADDIEKNKQRGDLGITYDLEVLRLIDAFRAAGFLVSSVVMTRYNEQEQAKTFEQRLNKVDIRVYRHYTISGYPFAVETIVSDLGYGKNDYVETVRPLIVVTAPGPGSGKMAACLSQLYHDHTRGIEAGYAKFETFPVWNLPLRHPVNIAYESATADLNDVNMIDPFHLDAYGVTTINYNRDVEIFPVLNNIFQRIYGESPYKSPTDMGVNMAGNCIVDEGICTAAAEQEIVRRHYQALCDFRQERVGESVPAKTLLLLKQSGLSSSTRPVIAAANDKAEATEAPAAALQLPDGRILTGKTSSLLGASSAVLLNALKALAGINDDILLLSPSVIEPIQKLKILHLGNNNPRLHTDEILIALAIGAVTSPIAQLALDQLERLKGSEMHTSVLLSAVDINVIRKLGINLTSEPVYQSKKLYHAIK